MSFESLRHEKDVRDSSFEKSTFARIRARVKSTKKNSLLLFYFLVSIAAYNLSTRRSGLVEASLPLSRQKGQKPPIIHILTREYGFRGKPVAAACWFLINGKRQSV